MKKGISTVIATILLLLIVIAIVGFAFGFFQKFFERATGTGTEQLTNTQQNIQKAAIVEYALGTSITIRNSGGVDLLASDLVLFVDGVKTDCSVTWTPSPITPGSVSTCTLTAPGCTAGAEIKVSTGGIAATGTCQ